jgi:threonine/homoserine/homoserine lactone efflux protein
MLARRLSGPPRRYIVTRGVGEGRSVALISVVGVCLGYVGHAVLAAAGVFVGRDSGSLSVLVLALIMPTIGLAVYSGWAALAGTLGDRLGRNPRFGDVLRWISGAVLIALGGKLALERR